MPHLLLREGREKSPAPATRHGTSNSKRLVHQGASAAPRPTWHETWLQLGNLLASPASTDSTTVRRRHGRRIRLEPRQVDAEAKAHAGHPAPLVCFRAVLVMPPDAHLVEAKQEPDGLPAQVGAGELGEPFLGIGQFLAEGPGGVGGEKASQLLETRMRPR